MKKLILASLMAIFALGAAAQQQLDVPYIEVQGKATRLVEPNRVEVRITLSEAPSKGKVKLESLESQLATALKQAGVDASKQLVVLSQSSAAQKRSSAYQFKSYLLTLSSADEMSAVFDALAANNVQDASVVRTYNTDQAAIDKEMQVEAMKNSQEMAQNLAAAVGQTIGKAIQIQYWNNTPAPFLSDNMLMRSAKVAVEGAELPDDVKMRPINAQCNVTVRYLLPQQ